MEVNINISNRDVQIPASVIQAAGGDELIARIFYNRGYTDPDTIRQMLHEEAYQPTLTSEFPDMQRAVERIARALKDSESILVYGDYDVDGVTSTVTLVQCLRWFTGNVSYHVPNRFTEGYGMNEEVIREAGKRGISLVITCDCGISNINEIRAAKSLGMDVIVTDHHNLPPVMPHADVILNPKLLGRGHRAANLSGCGMAYFLVVALLQHYNMEEKADEFLDLLALSLVADVVSLNGENRYLLKRAMPKLFTTSRLGLQEIIIIAEQSSNLQSEQDIAFQIAPRINAAGRMESAELPVELLLTENILAAREMAQKIDFLNKERKRLQEEIVKQAVELVETKKKNKTILVLFNETWHHGITGIAAGKISETYRKPAILLSMREDGITASGSARSVEGIDIYELLRECSGKLLKYGGHTAAAGLSLKREHLEEFTSEIEQIAEKMYYIKDKIRIEVDAELDIRHVDEGLYCRLEGAGPYGEGFEAPVFSSRSLTVASDRKTERNHHIMVLADGKGTSIPAVKWSGEDRNLDGKVYDVVYQVGRNTYKGNSQIQLTVEQLVECSGKPERVFSGKLADFRGKSPDAALSGYENCLVFYEGIGSLCHVKGAVDRYGIRKAGSIVLLSTPVNSLIFREIVSLAMPENIVINFSLLPDYTLKGFVLNLMGLLKHIMISTEGRASLEDLAIRMCVEEGILKAALKFLKASGKLEYSIDEDKLLVSKGKSVQQSELYLAEKNLKDALMEKRAYQQFLLSMDIEMFREYLK